MEKEGDCQVMSYTVPFDEPVYDELDEIPAHYERLIFDLIKGFATTPYPA